MPSCAIPCIVAALAVLPCTARSAPLTFSQIPTGSTWYEPAPNVILSIDDSGSMGWDLLGCATPDWDAINQGGVRNSRAGRTDCPPVYDNPRPSRMALLRESLFKTFGNTSTSPPSPGIITDGSIRLAWQAMHDNGNSISNRGATKLVPGAINSMRSFSGPHRQHFNAFVQSLQPSQDTPSHRMMYNALAYMQSKAQLNSPWADQPGRPQATPYAACRRSYHIFLTDGGWVWDAYRATPVAAQENGDGTSRILGDGAHTYDIHSPQTAIYRDTFDRDTQGFHTLSDLAFLAWAKDLQDGRNGTQNMANVVRPLMRHPTNETFTTPHCRSRGRGNSTRHCATLTPFWNPRNDPATWQHLTQYTIGFGTEATSWSTRNNAPPQWDDTLDDTYGGEFSLLANSERFWGNVVSNMGIRPSELWHMALNGRGKYFPARNAETLSAAFHEILANILIDSSAPVVASATNANYLRAGQQIFQAGYNGARFSGTLVARQVAPGTGAVQASIAWDAAAQLDAIAPHQRAIFSSHNNQGFSWNDYHALPAPQKTALNTNARGQADGQGAARWRYVRGDRSQEVASGGPFRDRNARLGDIVHSPLWYTGKPNSHHRGPAYATFRSTGENGQGNRMPMVYVGANDGMLHGFAAADRNVSINRTIAAGQELLAYIPAGIASGPLRDLTDPHYTHRYFVDGSVFTGDAHLAATNQWMTVLVGTLGAGGKGYFILNVTNPAHFQSGPASELVLLDTTDQTRERDLGHVFAPPVVDSSADNATRQIVQMNDGRWAVLLGNGYNSNNEAPVLLIQYLDGERALRKLSPCTQPIQSHHCAFRGGNGLSPPQAIDLNGDGKVDIAYAGDLRGHLWKFDLSSSDATQWQVAFNGAPFFVTQRKGHAAQAITTAPIWRQHPLGGTMIAFGTGRDLSTSDAFSTDTETLYALYDNSQWTAASGSVKITDGEPINGPDNKPLPATLVRQYTYTNPLADGHVNYYRSSTHDVQYRGDPTGKSTAPAHRGWYMDLPFPGQRVLHNPQSFSGEKVVFHSTIPSTSTASRADLCTPAPRQPKRTFLSVLNLFTGKPAATPPFHTTTVTRSPLVSPHTLTMLESPTESPTMVRTDTKIKLLSSHCPIGQTCEALEFQPGNFVGARAGWHQVQ